MYVDVFELNCHGKQVPHDRIESFSRKQALKLCKAYDAKIVSPCFDDERVKEIKELLVELIPYAVRGSVNLKIGLCKEECALSVSISSPFYAFYESTMHHIIRIAKNATKIAFSNNEMFCIFLLDANDI